MKLSATIITLNEEENLPRCLDSIKDLVDEIVLVDSGSSDRTVEIAKEYKAKIYFRKFDDFSSQKNYAVSKASGDWILSIDADEEVSEELALEIKQLKEDKKSLDYFCGFTIPRKNIILGKFIKHTRWQPELDRHIWLWKSAKGKWIGDVHEEVLVEGLVGKLKFPKIHYQYKSISEFMDMMNRYSELESIQKIKQGVKFSYIQFLFQPAYNFFIRFFYRLGILDGWRGFVLSYLMAIYQLEIWVKIWEKQKP